MFETFETFLMIMEHPVHKNVLLIIKFILFLSFSDQRQNNASLIGNLPASTSSIFDHPIVGFDGHQSSNSNETPNVPPVEVSDDLLQHNDPKIQNDESTNIDEKDPNYQRAPHAQKSLKLWRSLTMIMN